jgi:hypothetical protein
MATTTEMKTDSRTATGAATPPARPPSRKDETVTGVLISGALLAAVLVLSRWRARHAARSRYPDAWRTWERAAAADSKKPPGLNQKR